MCSESCKRYCECSRLSSSSLNAFSSSAFARASPRRWPRSIAFCRRSWKSIVERRKNESRQRANQLEETGWLLRRSLAVFRLFFGSGCEELHQIAEAAEWLFALAHFIGE